MLKKIIAAMLSLAILASTTVMADNSRKPLVNVPARTVSEQQTSEGMFTIEMLGKNIYTRLMTNEYNICMETLTNGEQSATIYYKESGLGTTYKVPNGMSFKDAKSAILKKELEVISQENFNGMPNLITRAVDPGSACRQALQADYGAPYSNKFLVSVYDPRGYKGYLYESMRFEVTKKHEFLAWANMAVTAIGAFAAWPMTAISAAFTLVSLASGGYAIYKDCTGYEYNATVYDNKEVEVNGTYPYRAGMTIKCVALVGDKAAVLATDRNIVKNSDFDDNVGLVKTGINNYING